MRVRGSRRSVGIVAAAAMLAALLAAPATMRAAEAAHTSVDACIQSVPEPGTTTPVDICYSLFQPDGASASSPVPLIFHSHGWGGSRTTSIASFNDWLNAGFGVLSFDQRGFGESGGSAHVENPDFEGQDVRRLVDLVASLDWVAQDGPGDPLIGAIGGSYGGGYQFVGAFSEMMAGQQRFDALAPEITWFDLKESLAPAEVVRTAWVTALFAAGVGSLPDEVRKGFVEGAATGEWPDGTGVTGASMDAFFERNGPAWHVANGRQLDIPVLFGQGMNDNLFNANQGIKNFQQAITPGARASSIFVGYNGGHVLPNALPPSVPASGDPCSPALAGAGSNFSALARKFFTEQLKGTAAGLAPAYGKYHLATAGGACLQTGTSLGAPTAYPLGTAISPTGVGGPVNLKLADGPVTVAGIPTVDADVTPLGVDGRAFFALSVGRTPADAAVVQANMMPIHEHDVLPGTTNARTVELPGIAVAVPAGQSLFLTVSAVSDMSFGHGSRTPGALLFENLTVNVPQV